MLSTMGNYQEVDLQVREIESDNRDYWNQSISDLPTGHILQTFEWGEFKSHHGWRPIHLLFTKNNHVKAAAMILKRPLPILGMSILYVPKGPCFDPNDLATLTSVLYKLKEIAQSHRALFVKIDPDITMDNDSVIDTLKRTGFQLSPDQVQFKNTMVVDLSLPVEELRSNLGKSTRYNINLAGRKKVEIVEGTANDLQLFYDIYRETSERDHFLIRPYEYYREIWKSLLDRKMAKIFLARYNDVVLAGSVLLLLGNRAWYMYGASTSVRREMKPNHILQWHAMLWAKQNGYGYYDMWGLPNVLEPGQPMWGVYDFKKGLGGQVRQWIGAYDYPRYPILYYAWVRLLPRYMHFLRRVRGLPSAEPTG